MRIKELVDALARLVDRGWSAEDAHDGSSFCYYCGAEGTEPEHEANCPWVEAKAILYAACSACKWHDEGMCGHPRMFVTDRSVIGGKGVWVGDPYDGVAVGPEFSCVHFDRE